MVYDVVIVGARCAGASLAMLLARQGHKVLAVDRAHFPSDTMSTHFLQTPGVARLNRWGLLDDLLASGCPPINDFLMVTGSSEFPANFPPTDSIPGNFAPRRTILDALLVDAARASGAEIEEGFYFEDVLKEDERVIGVKGRSGNVHKEIRARFVIGADGRNSSVASAIGASFVKYEKPVSCGYYGYFAGDFPPRAEQHIDEELSLITFPTHSAQVVIAGWAPEMFKKVRSNPGHHLLTAWEGRGEIGEILSSSEPEERIIGTADVPNFLRESWGPGWALVGDAAYHTDPTPADGMNDAFRGADKLSVALDSVLRETGEAQMAFGSYERDLVSHMDATFQHTLRTSNPKLPIAERFQSSFQLVTHRIAEQMEFEHAAV